MTAGTDDTAGKPAERVILIHGTFASDDTDTGLRWWQKDGRFISALEERLPTEVRHLDRGDFFAWSGRNSYAERRRAANDLFDYLRRFETEQIPYHLVAHSHGGAVAWDMLAVYSPRRRVEWRDDGTLRSKFLRWITAQTSQQQFDNQHDPFAHLRSVTTVGTPFIHWAPRLGLPGRLGLALSPIINVLWFISLFIASLFLVIAVMEGEISVRNFMLFVSVTVAFILLVLGPLLAMAAYFDVSRTMAIERNKMRQAVHRYGPKWLGIYSANDEALNALRASLSLRWQSLYGQANSTPKPFPEANEKLELDDRGNPRFWARVYRIDRLTFWPFRKLVTGLLPLVNRFVARRLTALALGSDRSGAAALRVSTVPIPDLPDIEPLSPAAEERLRNTADINLARAAPVLRKLITEWGSTGVVQIDKDITADLGDDVLIHTSYFNDEEVVGLISTHMSSVGVAYQRDNESTSPRSWYIDFLRRRDEALATFNRMFDQRQLPGQKLNRRDRIIVFGVIIGLPILAFLLYEFDPFNL